MSRKPSEKDIWKVKMIMKHTGVEPEKEVFENAETCKAFIKNHRKTYPPTDEEISNVQELQKETGLAVPDGFLRSGYLTFRLTCLLESIAYTINNPVFEYDGEFDTVGPTDAMVSFAKVLASECAVTVPSRVLHEKASCHEFIQHCKRHRPASKKLIDSAKAYTARAGIEVPEEVLVKAVTANQWKGMMEDLCEFEGGGVVTGNL